MYKVAHCKQLSYFYFFKLTNRKHVNFALEINFKVKTNFMKIILVQKCDQWSKKKKLLSFLSKM